jgi:predicted nucleotidyltransferase
MSYLQTNFEKLRAAYGPVIDGLERAFQRMGIDYYLIGAQSRDLWTGHLAISERATRDIDFAIYIHDMGEWDGLCLILTNEEKFERDAKEPYRFYYRGDTIDLIPFGAIEQDGEVVLDGPRTELSVYGCLEATTEAETVSGKFKAVTLPGICILKLIAFEENAGNRAKDWDDFLFILNNYPVIAGEKLYEGAHDDLIMEDFELGPAAARMLGRHMQTMLNRNIDLKNKIRKILEAKLMKFSPIEIDEMYVLEKEDTLITRIKLIYEVIRGISDSL